MPFEAATIDLSGVPCPLNWARAKARLECMTPGDQLWIVTDDPRAERDIPGAAEAEGWAVLEVRCSAAKVRILVER